MEPNVNRIRSLMADRGWSASELARQMGVSRSETTRLLSGQRKGGKKIISGLIRAFPDESLDSLFFLSDMYPNVNIKKKTDVVKGQKAPDKFYQVRHPLAHQLACTIDETKGEVKIKQGKCLTTLKIPPGHVDIKYSEYN